MTPTVIMKFGGSCLVDKSAFKTIVDILNIYEDYKKVIVASAFNGITDLLLNTAHSINDSRILDGNIAILEKKHYRTNL